MFDEQAARDHRIVTPFGVFLLFQYHLPVCDVFLFVLSIVDGYKVVWRVGNIYIYICKYVLLLFPDCVQFIESLYHR